MQAKTDFPKKPHDRWTDWKGLLRPGDEYYIFTRSVFEYLYRFKVKYYIEKYSEPDLAESISHTFFKMQKICQKINPLPRTVLVSIKKMVEAIHYHYIRMLLSNQRKRWSFSFADIWSNPSIPVKEQNVFFKNEFYRIFYQSMQELNKEQKQLIQYKLEGKTFSWISRQMNQNPYHIRKLYKEAMIKIDKHCQTNGVDIYREQS